MRAVTRKGHVPSIKEENGTSEGEEYFLILRNCRKSMDIISSSDKDIIPDEDGQLSSEKKDEESLEPESRRRRRVIKKEKKSKNYSSVSQNKR